MKTTSTNGRKRARKLDARVENAALKAELASVRVENERLQRKLADAEHQHKNVAICFAAEGATTARLRAELERLRGRLRTYLERCEREIGDRKTRANFRADWTKDIGPGDEP